MHRGVVKARTDPDYMRKWWGWWPDASIGVQVTGLGVVVLDEDGVAGRGSMAALLAEAGVGLPATYEVTTGRADGGRHLWYRLPDGCPPLATQNGQADRHPGLDVKFNGIVVGAWSLHSSGEYYRPNWLDIPRAQELPCLPVEIYQALLRVGQVGSAPKPRRPRRRKSKQVAAQGQQVTAGEPGAVHPMQMRVVVGSYLRSLLMDTSDGRNNRCFKAIRRMVVEGYDREALKATLLAYPLGDKAREQPDPDRYIDQMIESAEAMVAATTMPDWDRNRYWAAVHSAGLTSAQTRLLDHMLDLAWFTGTLSRGQARLGLGAALSPGQVPECLQALESQGWVVLLNRADKKHRRPARYGLAIPSQGQTPSTVLLARTPEEGGGLRPLIGLSTWGLSFDPGHDAFRWASGSLHRAYRLLCRLDATARTTGHFSTLLRCSAKTTSRMITDLRQAGLLVTDDQGKHRLVDAPVNLTEQLDTVATKAGTAGQRYRAEQEYYDKIQQWAEDHARWSAEVATPGTTAWRTVTAKHYAQQIEHPSWKPVVDLWLAAGKSKDEIIADSVRSEEQAMTGGPLWIA